MASPAANLALRALRDRFPPEELRELAGVPYPDVLRAARVRRADELVRSRWAETPASARETPVIVALHALFVEVEAAAGRPAPPPWDGGML